MNWYKLSQTQTMPFIDKVLVSAHSVNHLVLIIDGKRHEYNGLPGSAYASQIERWKKSKNKNKSGSDISYLLRNIEQYRIK